MVYRTPNKNGVIAVTETGIAFFPESTIYVTKSGVAYSKPEIFIWDLDGVAYEGNATTHLAKKMKKDFNDFRKRFADECEREGPLSDVSKVLFDWYLGTMETPGEWEQKNGVFENGYVFAKALTDARHKGEIFTSKHTKYTKNAILEGISMAEVSHSVDDVVLMDGFEQAVDGLNRIKVTQIVFSNASYPFAESLRNKYGMSYAKGVPVMVIDKNGEKVLYEPGMQGDSEIVLAGELGDYKWDKIDAFKEFIESRGISPNSVVAVDDDHIKILNGVGLPLGFNVKEKYKKDFRDAGIPIIKGRDLSVIPEIVKNPETLKLYTE